MVSRNPAPRNAARTRARILSEARREFTRAGYSATTVRVVAEAAGVSPNLITRYFGGKEGLFVAATEVDLRLDPVLDGPRESFGLRLAESAVTRWTTMAGEDPLLTLHRAAGERPEAAAALAMFLDEQSLAPVRRQLQHYGFSDIEADLRARAIDAFILGVTTRYRALRDDLGDAQQAKRWIAQTVQWLVDPD
ncbi:MAG: TetR family transcriptional regulator [Leifsonia sp.]